MEKMEESREIDNGIGSINTLNDDCLRLVFQYLPIVEKIKVERVCKRWQKLSKESWYTFKRLDLCPSTWGWPDDTEKKFIDNDILHEVLIRCSQYLNDVDLRRNQSKILLYYVSIKDICLKCQRLKSLNLSDLSSSRRGHNCPYTDSEGLIDSLLLTCQNLIKFGLEPCYSGYHEKDLGRLFDNMRKIKYLRLGSYHRPLYIDGECLLHLPNDTIEEIVLVGCTFLQPSFFRKAFDSFDNLETLVLCNCQSVNDYALLTLAFHLKTLKALGITGSCLITEEGMKKTIRLKNLQKLNVMGNQSFTDDVLTGISANCQQLAFLDISFCQRITDKGILSTAFLSNLNHLIISQTKNISDEHLGRLHNLKYLEAGGCTRLKDDGLCELLETNLRLEVLHLEGSLSITDKLLTVATNATKERRSGAVLKISTSNTAMKRRESVSPFLSIVKSIRRVRGGRRVGFQDVFFLEGEDTYQVHEY
ncbi:F-box/LRR-repeat protein 4-like isoform X2 [Belonocnema kinseyi]|nr:F-box/LRR-repeat protein 4-like isoform X2 [Belonocnema kinseyi]XP_033231232.1 F-box/LRR-repeat protein 4-like isoform X2 [Belonocnema kinseyi]XP_033231233.1 F-box/LRR-repeat protein 4-like isoform X2 [Belonocnema kinseyi]XP_033231234.1 F-box/LRR-repeat protein 4-like isoform X2 [Belonocnema kinseyi]XP_033231235.1 F-box/LRR-repeat protein 4-like isoform X2 [Belonocnema kinseyi]XP_033231236.1 F-box/LRR-repeat protein 4-like isoform X2 [Belonocnema kinseyi]